MKTVEPPFIELCIIVRLNFENLGKNNTRLSSPETILHVFGAGPRDVCELPAAGFRGGAGPVRRVAARPRGSRPLRELLHSMQPEGELISLSLFFL